ncbi:hypothetical protein MDA_GLEAN10009496 [Myotis davidii]|uniref:Uncharacterized protein n=1 Tax=Myotis davidii TaxID=225400 RepID=L5M0J1_MYODS|nr:hypothetical protein MDA_GLEAN10009496 [Myotis davidii]
MPRPEALGLGRGGACNHWELGVPCPGLTPLSEASGLGKGPILRLEGDGGQRLRAPMGALLSEHTKQRQRQAQWSLDEWNSAVLGLGSGSSPAVYHFVHYYIP